MGNLSSDPPVPLHRAVLRAARHCLVASSLLPSVKVFPSVSITWAPASYLCTPASSSLCLLCTAITGTPCSSFSSATEEEFRRIILILAAKRRCGSISETSRELESHLISRWYCLGGGRNLEDVGATWRAWVSGRQALRVVGSVSDLSSQLPTEYNGPPHTPRTQQLLLPSRLPTDRVHL